MNDDVSVFQDLAVKAALRAADFENATFYSRVITTGSGLGPNLSDGVAVYNSAHGNVASAGALSVTLLGEARQKLREQASLDGIKMNVQGSILLVSAASETLAEQLVAPLSPAQFSNANPFQGRLTVIADSNLSGTRFYVLSDPGRGSNYVYGSLDGQEGPRIETRQGWEIEGIEMKMVIDLAVGGVDHKFGVTGAGA